MILALVNLKGGAGKSNIAVNLSCQFASRKKAVFLVDADEQGTATYYAAGALLPIAHEQIPLIPGGNVDRWLKRILSLASRTDYLFIDAPPHVGNVTKAIIGLADLAIVPCTPSTADLVATSSTIELIRATRLARSDKGPRCLMVPSRVDRRTSAGREIVEVLARFGEPVGPVIHQRSAFVDAFTARRWIGDFDPGGPAHSDIIALAKKIL